MGYTELKFRTFSELLAEVSVDLRNLEEEGMIEPATLIKVAQRVNYDLGLRIHQTKECIIDIENSTGRLPNDFYVLDFALVLGKYKSITPVTWAGRTTENINIDCSASGSCATTCLLPLTGDPSRQYNICSIPNSGTPEWDPFFQRSVYSTCEGSCVKVCEKQRYDIREYEFFERLYIKPQKYLNPGSINSKFIGETCPAAEIKNGFLYTNIKNCRVYLSYQGNLEDEDGNLLVLNHPEIDNYYIAALKEKIFENLYMSGEDVKDKLQYFKQETRESRLRALNIVNMPDFQELQKNWATNRAAQYRRYYQAWHTGVFNSYFRPSNLPIHLDNYYLYY